MECPSCTYENVSVTDTRHKEPNIIERRRECPRCGLRFVTQEKFKNLTKAVKSHVYVG